MSSHPSAEAEDFLKKSTEDFLDKYVRYRLDSPQYLPLFDGSLYFKAAAAEYAQIMALTEAAVNYAEAAENYAKAVKAHDKAVKAYWQYKWGYKANEERAQALKAEREQKKKEQQDKQEYLITVIAALCAIYSTLNPQTDNDDDDSIDIALSAEGVTNLTVLIGNAIIKGIKTEGTQFGFIGQTVEGLAWLISATCDKERSSLHNKIWDGVQAASATLLLLGTGLDFLHTLIGFGPVAFSSLINIFCVTLVAGTIAQYLYYISRDVRKILDTDYFITEREEAITAELKLLLNRKERPTMDELVRVNKKITVLKAQAEALRYYKVCVEKGNLEPEGKSEKQQQQIAVAKFLIEKEKSKAKEHTLKCAIWVVAAAVLITAAILMPPSLIVIGLIISAANLLQIGVDVAYNKYTGVSLKHAEREGHKKDILVNNGVINSTEANSKENTQDRLLEKALIDTGLNRDTAKEWLSEKDKQKLIHEQARREYARELRLRAGKAVFDSIVGRAVHSLASEVTSSASRAASTASSAFCAFFSGTAAKGGKPSIPQIPSELEISTYMGKC